MRRSPSPQLEWEKSKRSKIPRERVPTAKVNPEKDQKRVHGLLVRLADVDPEIHVFPFSLYALKADAKPGYRDSLPKIRVSTEYARTMVDFNVAKRDGQKVKVGCVMSRFKSWVGAGGSWLDDKGIGGEGMHWHTWGFATRALETGGKELLYWDPNFWLDREKKGEKVQNMMSRYRVTTWLKELEKRKGRFKRFRAGGPRGGNPGGRCMELTMAWLPEFAEGRHEEDWQEMVR